MRALVLVLLTLVVSACGFQLRGSYDLPWRTLYIELPESDELYLPLRRRIEMMTQSRVVDDPKQASATLVIMRSTTNKNILSLSAKGRVREFQLTRIFVYQVKDKDGNELVPTNQIILQRELTFDDQQYYAKEAEEAQIQKEMKLDIVHQLLRRLATVANQPVRQ